MKKKILAALLLLCMLLTVFTACTTEPAPSGGSSENSNTPAPTPANTNNGSNPPAASDDPGEGEEIVEIEYWIFAGSGGGSGTDESREKVQEAINAISEEAIGVHVNFTWIPTSDYATQLNLAISNKETVDLALYTYMGPLAMFYSSGACMDITDLVDTYGQAIKEVHGDLLKNASWDGRLYGMPVARNFNSDGYIIMRQDALDSVNMQSAFDSMTTWAEFENILQAITDKGETFAIGGGENGVTATPNMAAIVGSKLSDGYIINTMGDSLMVVACGDDGVVSLLQKDAGFVSTCKTLADWNAKGYIYPDSAYTGINKMELVAANTFASYIGSSEYGYGVTAGARIGVPVASRLFIIGAVDTTKVAQLGSFVPVTAEEPEAAVKFYNLMYTNADVMNLLVYGIEGENYVVNAAGEAAYPAGKDVSNCGYRQDEFWFGNDFLLYPVEGNGTNFRQEALDNFRNAPVYKYPNANVDLGDYGALVASIKSVQDEFRQMMLSGMYTEAYYNEYISKLEAAGAEDYLALFQAAADAYQA